MFLLLLIIGVIFLMRGNKQSLAYYFTLIVVISLIGNLFIKENYSVDTSDVLHVIWIFIVLAFTIYPWKSYYGVKEVTCSNPRRLKTVTIILIVFLLIQLVGCAILAFYVTSTVEDINYFKYREGTTSYYYSLGINLTPYMLATLFYPLSYIMVPLHLYYLSKGEKSLSLWCLIASLLSVVYGLTYFSRAHLIHYLLIYLGSYWLLRDTLSQKSVKQIKKVMLIGGVAVLAYFISISITRFEGHDYDTHSGVSVSNSTVVNSLFDYLVMWWNNSEIMFCRFDWNTMGGQIAFGNLNRLISMFGVQLGPTADVVMQQREALMKEYAGSFIGIGEYYLYDFGPIISIFVLSIYASFVNRFKPNRHRISVDRLLYVSLLVLLPTFAIFYSILNVVLLTFVFLIPINMYLTARR